MILFLLFFLNVGPLVNGELDGVHGRPCAEVVHPRLQPLLPCVKVHAGHLIFRLQRKKERLKKER